MSEQPQPIAPQPVADEPTADNDNAAETGESTPVEPGETDTATPAQGNNGSAPPPAAAPSNTRPTPSGATPVAPAPVIVRQPASPDVLVRAEKPFKFDAVEARSSLRRLADEEEAAAEIARNRAAEVQKDRILRGLLDAIANTDPAVVKNTLLNETDAEEPKTSLVETYYAQA
ncbi:hypothetical protein [Agrobacterium rubi]|uniref:Uncharacterized protein n=1 Tax=Agrobacterium rubi TaxID=28099 RepID=A0AAE7RBT1_9HYPH|nr:hypothetical protein [Agrobacterium rubi]NTE85834.1 hypothetical protein [Agrobacterium rubi]NTF01766.1 hypothetical protein [Agrobacterium rubi]NTF36009.1 hypothetical protein [Agrobacterium rubi]OCJ53188.1 hypothetical protein A6U92_24800 [Agrobacterium rubi]QTG01099.1 hypothetical protein G6M88_12205 [Agrobacterium rubi]